MKLTAGLPVVATTDGFTSHWEYVGPASWRGHHYLRQPHPMGGWLGCIAERSTFTADTTSQPTEEPK